MTRKTPILTSLMFFVFSTCYLPSLSAQSQLPEGAKEWFGKGRIYDVKYSSNGKRLAVTASQGLWIYDSNTYQLLRYIKKYETEPRRAVLSPDGNIIACEEELSRIHVWDVNTRQHKYEIMRGRWVRYFDFSADGKNLVTVDVHNQLTFWNAETGAQEKQTKSQNSMNLVDTYCSTFDMNNLILAIGNLNNNINLWDQVKGVEKKTLIGHKDVPNCLAFSPDGKTIASGSGDRTLRVWDTVKGEQKHIFSGDDVHSIESLAFNQAGSLLAGGDEFGHIHLVDPNTGEYKKRLEGHSREVVAISFSANMLTLVSGSKDGSIRIWDIASGENKQTIDGFFNEITSFCVSSEGKTIAMAGRDRNVCLWDATTGKREKTILKVWGDKNIVTDIAFSQDGNFIAIGNSEEFLWDRNTGKPNVIFMRPMTAILSVVFSLDGKTIVVGGGNGTVLLLDVDRRGQERHVIPAHEGRVTSVTYSPDGKTIVSASEDKTIKLWDANTYVEKKVFTGHANGLTDVALSTDGKTIAAVDNTVTIYLWDVDTSKLKKLRTGHTADVLSVALSPDGKRLAAGDANGAVYILDTETGISKQRFAGHQRKVKGVAFAADGNVLASLSDDGAIFMWNVSMTE